MLFWSSWLAHNATKNASFQSANVLHMGSTVHLPASFRRVTTDDEEQCTRSDDSDNENSDSA